MTRDWQVYSSKGFFCVGLKFSVSENVEPQRDFEQNGRKKQQKRHVPQGGDRHTGLDEEIDGQNHRTYQV